MPLYNSIETIPAKVFFDIMESKDYQQLKPKPKEKDLDKVFMQIYDDYFIKSENTQASEFLRLQNILLVNAYKISILKQSLAFYFYNKTTQEMRHEFIEALKVGFCIHVDESIPFIDEVRRLLDIEIGILQNEISLAKIDLEAMKLGDQGKPFDFYEAMIGLSNVLIGNSLIKEEMTLAVYVALEKSARKQIEHLSKKK